MPKIKDVGVGKFIRSPRGRRGQDSKQMNVEVLQITTDDGNNFICYPVTSTQPLTLDTTRYQQIPRDTNVDVVTI